VKRTHVPDLLSPVSSNMLGKSPSAHIPIVIDRKADALFRHRRVLPTKRLEPRALQILIDCEEVLDLFQIVGRQIGKSVMPEWYYNVVCTRMLVYAMLTRNRWFVQMRKAL
jgi:hypothetical protein